MPRSRRPKVELDDERNDRPLQEFRQRKRAGVPTQSPQQCEHLLAYPGRDVGSPGGCDDHVTSDGPMVHLRTCLLCGNVGCCDSSRDRAMPQPTPSVPAIR
jgi:hypothetical protein